MNILRPRYVVSRSRRKITFIPWHTILFFRAEDKYVVVVHEKGEVLINQSLKWLNEKFSSELIRVHNSFLVFRNRVKRMDRDGWSSYLTIWGYDESIPVSKNYVSKVKEQFGRKLANRIDFVPMPLTSVFRKKRENRIEDKKGNIFYEVKCIYADSKYLQVVHRDGQTLIAGALRWFEKEYPDLFLRAHRNALIVPEYVVELSIRTGFSHKLILDDSEIDLTLSRRQSASVINYFDEG